MCVCVWGGGGCTNACNCIRAHSQPFLQNPNDGCLGNLVGMKYSCSLTSVVVSGQIRPGAGPKFFALFLDGAPFFKELLQTRRLQQETECIVMIKKHVGSVVIFFIPFRSQINEAFMCHFGVF